MEHLPRAEICRLGPACILPLRINGRTNCLSPDSDVTNHSLSVHFKVTTAFSRQRLCYRANSQGERGGLFGRHQQDKSQKSPYNWTCHLTALRTAREENLVGRNDHVRDHHCSLHRLSPCCYRQTYGTPRIQKRAKKRQRKIIERKRKRRE